MHLTGQYNWIIQLSTELSLISYLMIVVWFVLEVFDDW